jgi:hypothetical protein
MNDHPPATGHNKPPAFDPDKLAELEAKAKEFADAAGEWKEAGKIDSAEQAQKANDFLSTGRAIHKQIEETRKVEKEPFLAAGREVDSAFNSLKDIVERAAALVKPLAEAFLREQEAAERKRRDEEARKAREEAAEAERARLQAEARNDVVGQQEAEQREKAAREAEKEASKTESAKLGSATGGGKSTSLRTRRWAEITNINQAMLHYRDSPEMADLLFCLANAEVRASKGKPLTIPGFTIKEERKL